MTQSKIRFLTRMSAFIILCRVLLLATSSNAQSHAWLRADWSVNNVIAVINNQQQVELYNHELELLNRLPAIQNPIKLKWSPNGQYLAVIVYKAEDRGFSVQIWDFSNIDMPQRMVESGDGEVSSAVGIAWHPSNEQFAVYNDYPPVEISVYPITSSSPVLTIDLSPAPGEPDKFSPFTFLAWSADGQYLAGGNVGVLLWSITGQSVQPLGFLAPSDYGVTPVFSPTSNEIALASGTDLEIWDANQQQPVRSLSHSHEVAYMVWTPQNLVSLSIDGQIWRWQAGSSALLSTAETGESNVTAIWRPDGSEVLLLPAEMGQMPHIRNTTTGAIVSEMCASCVQSHSPGS
jgi:hypothetical protein